jgi:hypothetical protein
MTDWWMYHADQEHSGAAALSVLNASNVHLVGIGPSIAAINESEIFQSAPVVVSGKVFIVSTVPPSSTDQAHLYRLDLASWSIDEAYSLPVGSNGSPAVSGEWVYITSMPGKVYCLPAFDFKTGPRWVTDLVNRDIAHTQYVQDAGNAWCWTSPLVVNDHVYVGTGQGDWPPGTFGFVRCLDASSGCVEWLFCTCQAVSGQANQPNFIPPSLVTGPLPSPFQQFKADPPSKGASVWSSPAFEPEHNAIVVGTGNSFPDTVAPAPKYAAGVIALDATTGALLGSFTSAATESYRPTDKDIDFGASPTIIPTASGNAVGIGGKSGSYYILRSPTLQLLKSRQLLPYLHDNRLQPLPSIDNDGGDFGTLSAAAITKQSQILVGVGLTEIDSETTPFIRCLSVPALQDVWPTAVGPDGIRRYAISNSPLYRTPGETGLSSPVTINDVALMTTSAPVNSKKASRVAVYAFSNATGQLLWSSRSLPTLAEGSLAIGMAVSNDTYVFGCDNLVFQCGLQTKLPGGTQLGTPGLAVTAASDQLGQLDVVVAWTDGLAYASNYSDNRGTWAGWSALPGGVPGLPTGAPITLLSRLPNVLDAFATGNGGVAYTATFGESRGTWEGWFSLGAPIPGVNPGAPISVIAREPGAGHWLDAWVVGASGVVYTNAYNDTRATWGGWTMLPGSVPGLPAGAPVTVLSRLPGLIDVFALGSGGQMYANSYTDAAGNWVGWFLVSAPIPGANPGAPLSVIAREPGAGHWLDAWVVGASGVVYTNAYNDTRATWGGWTTLPGSVPGLPAGAPVTVLSRLPGLIDVFAFGSGGQMYANSYTDAGGNWIGWSSVLAPIPGVNPGAPLSVISREPGAGHWLDAWAGSGDTVLTASYNDTRGTWVGWFNVPS